MRPKERALLLAEPAEMGGDPNNFLRPALKCIRLRGRGEVARFQLEPAEEVNHAQSSARKSTSRSSGPEPIRKIAAGD